MNPECQIARPTQPDLIYKRELSMDILLSHDCKTLPLLATEDATQIAGASIGATLVVRSASAVHGRDDVFPLMGT